MTSDERAQIKQCIAWFLCGEMGELRCEVGLQPMDALKAAESQLSARRANLKELPQRIASGSFAERRGASHDENRGNAWYS
jgi:hypothetical protein